VPARPADPMLVMLSWLAALRHRDFAALEALYVPDVVWESVRPHLHCADRDAVMATLRGYADQNLDIEAIELVTSPVGVVLGTRMPALREVAGAPFDGQVFTVFTIRDGSIVAMNDHFEREEALRAAGVPDPAAIWR
jgi:ketosteroid isomerase-like protein